MVTYLSYCVAEVNIVHVHHLRRLSALRLLLLLQCRPRHRRPAREDLEPEPAPPLPMVRLQRLLTQLLLRKRLPPLLNRLPRAALLVDMPCEVRHHVLALRADVGEDPTAAGRAPGADDGEGGDPGVGAEVVEALGFAAVNGVFAGWWWGCGLEDTWLTLAGAGGLLRWAGRLGGR